MDTNRSHPAVSGFAATVLDSFTATLALVTADECGVLASLETSAMSCEDIAEKVKQGDMLVWMLEQSGITARDDGGRVRLGDGYAALMPSERLALVERAKFSLLAAQDMIAGRRSFFNDPGDFFARARAFGFFCYGRARETHLGNIQDTEAWVNYVSALNDGEAAPLAECLPLQQVRGVLEIGGNAGGFALAMLARKSDLRAVVMDLPAVCEIGQKRTLDAAGGDRLQFLAGDATRDSWPEVNGAPPDLICFKSVLHDWDAENTRDMIERAVRHLPAGGRIAILERGRVQDASEAGDFRLASNLVFSGFYRRPEWYEEALAVAGLEDIARKTCVLDLPFHVITGRKPS